MDMPSELTVNGVRYVREDAARPQGPTPIERWFAVSELAEMSGFSKASLYRAMDAGRLDYRCPNGSRCGRRVSEGMWDSYVASLTA